MGAHRNDKIERLYSKRRLLLTAICALVFLAGIGFLGLQLFTYQPNSVALAALNSTSDTVVRTERWIEFIPQMGFNQGVIIYPGGLIDPRAYAGLCKLIAYNGKLCVITPMPLNLAILAPNKAAEVVAVYPHIQKWIIVGHSLGGPTAARFLQNSTTNNFIALVLLGSYSDVAVSNRVISITGTNDQVVDRTQQAQSARNLPASYTQIAIEGGNHSGFGDYGLQTGDGAATITSSEQQIQTAKIILQAFN
jgi:hypothetical protein